MIFFTNILAFRVLLKRFFAHSLLCAVKVLIFLKYFLVFDNESKVLSM